MSAKKSYRPKARKPRGFEDRTGDVLRAEQHLIQTAATVYEKWGFEPLQTPAFEYAEALGKFLPDEERPNEGVFALEDDDGQWLSLRYDHTAPLARFVAERYQDLNKPYRRFQIGDVWRNEKPGPGRFRQFIQCDADTVGAAGPAADAEMIAMARELFTQVVLNKAVCPIEMDVRMNFSTRLLLDAVLEKLGNASSDLVRLRVLRSIDKFDKLGQAGVFDLLTEGRKDESGDFTEGAGLLPYQASQVIKVLLSTFEAAGDRVATIQHLETEIGDCPTGVKALGELQEITNILDALEISRDEALIMPSIVRGLGYYTGPVFEAEIASHDVDEAMGGRRLGSVGGGGRYDDLVSRFTGQTVPATGFSFGVSRFATALVELQRRHRLVGAMQRPLVIIVAAEKDRSADYLAMAQELRASGLRAEAFVGGGNMGKQMKYADRRGAHAAVIVGSNEREEGQVTIKDLKLGARLASDIEDNKQWREEQPAQITVKKENWVAGVREVVSRYK